VGSWSATETFDVLKDPRLSATIADLQRQFDLQAEIVGRLKEGAEAVGTIRSVTKQLADIAQRATDGSAPSDIKPPADAIVAKLQGIERTLVQAKGEEGLAQEPKLLSQLAWVNAIVASADARPTDQAGVRVEDLKTQLAAQLQALRAVLDGDVARFNALMRERGVPPVAVPVTDRRVATPEN
jgi:hypothetical protein